MKKTNNNSDPSYSSPSGRPGGDTELATDKQVKYLHVLYGKLYLDEDTYRTMLKHNYGVESSRDLTRKQAWAFITRLTTIVEQLDDRITDKQLYLVRQLWRVIDYAKGAEGDAYLNKFVLKFYRKPTVADITKQEAIRLIKQIGQMTKQAEARKGKTTVLKRRTRCAHCGEWIMWVELADGRREAFDCIASPNPSEGGGYLATDFHKCK